MHIHLIPLYTVLNIYCAHQISKACCKICLRFLNNLSKLLRNILNVTFIYFPSSNVVSLIKKSLAKLNFLSKDLSNKKSAEELRKKLFEADKQWWQTDCVIFVRIHYYHFLLLQCHQNCTVSTTLKKLYFSVY